MKVAVAGLGYMGSAHLGALLQIGLDPGRITGIDPDPRARTKAEREYNIRTFADLSELPEPKTHAVCIAAPSPLHLNLLNQCASLGIWQVLVEKPLVLNTSELTGVQGTRVMGFVGYVINFSEALTQLAGFINGQSLELLQVHAFWGNNWIAKGRWIGPNIAEELPHPLVAALSLGGRKAFATAEAKGALLTHVQYMHRSLQRADRNDNDTSLALFTMRPNDRDVPISIVSSFNLFEQERIIDVSLAHPGDDVAAYRARIEFDTGDGARVDTLRIIEAETRRPVRCFERLEFAGDKLAAQDKAALLSLFQNVPDGRLVDFERAGIVLRLLDQASK